MKMNTRDSFKVFLIFSLVAHLVLSVYFFINPDIDLFKKKNIHIKNAVRVDSIGLPELQQKSAQIKSVPVKKKPIVKKPEKKKVKKKQVKKVIKKKTTKLKKKVKKSPLSQLEKDVIDKKKLQQQQTEAIDKLKALERIDQIKREVEETPSYKGAKISEGNSQTGEEVHDFEVVKYFTLLISHINMYWNLPQELAAQNLRAKVYVEINNDGIVLKKQIKESSGNEEFDVRVLETIERASPFPRPVSSVQKQLSDGLVFGFPQ